MSPTVHQDRLLSLLDAWQQGRGAGCEPTPEDLCPDDPTLREALREHIAVARRFDPKATLVASTEHPYDEPNGTALPPAPPGYRLLRELGRGGMGVVYEAVQTRLNRTVALKVVRDGSGGTTRSRFLVEAEAVAAARHPNVVQVYESGESDGRAFLAMEYLAGGTLAERLKTAAARLDSRAAAELVVKIARGVQAAHDRQIVHRDLKPGNVLFDEAGEPKVTDFGLAKYADREDLTITGMLLGTPVYMAPEQADGKTKFVGPGVDVWALGVILYECLTGTRPFAAPTSAALVRQIVEAAPEPPRKRESSVPRDLELICLKCLEKQPGDRYPSAAALADDLSNFLTGRPITARPVSVLARAVKLVRRNPVPAALVCVFLLGCAGTTAASLVALDRARERAAEKVGRERAERDAAIRTAMQANDLRGTVTLVEAAEKDGQPVPLELRFAAAIALGPLNRADESRKRLSELLEVPDLPAEFEARIQLRLADDLIGIDDERALDLLTRARRSGKLPPADLAYADALVAPRMPDAVTNLQLALRHDPTHFPARRLLCLYLTVSGRLDEAIRAGDAGRIVARDHPDILFPLVLAHSFKGNETEALELFELLRPHLDPAMADHFYFVCRLLPLSAKAFRSGLDGTKLELPFDYFKIMAAATRAAKAGQGEPLRALNEAIGGRFMRVPPAYRDSLGGLLEFGLAYAEGRDFCLELAQDGIKLAQFKAQLDRRPEGFMVYLYAFALTTRAQGYQQQYGSEGGHGSRWRELNRIAADAYATAAETPMTIDVRAFALEAAAMHYSIAGRPGWGTFVPDADALEKSAVMVRKRVDLALTEPMTNWRRPLMVVAARKAGDYTTARRILDAWEKESGAANDFGVLGHRAQIEFGARAYLPALEAARKVLAKEPTHPAMRKMEADCLAQIRFDPQRLAPPPRPKADPR